MMWMVGACITPTDFPVKKLREITFAQTAETFEVRFKETYVSKQLQSLCTSKEFEEWSETRNILMHRIRGGPSGAALAARGSAALL
jgi:hypothetical protein